MRNPFSVLLSQPTAQQHGIFLKYLQVFTQYLQFYDHYLQSSNFLQSSALMQDACRIQHGAQCSRDDVDQSASGTLPAPSCPDYSKYTAMAPSSAKACDTV